MKYFTNCNAAEEPQKGIGRISSTVSHPDLGGDTET